MKIAILGTGYVGLTAGTCFSDLGHDVICVDIDQTKIDNLNKGILPIFEPGLKELVERNNKQNRLKFTTDKIKAIQESEVIFIAVGTPEGENHKADLRFVRAVAEDIGKNLNSYKVIVNKSTVPVGTADLVKNIIKQHTDKEFDVVSNPEFLREGEAIADFTYPERVIVGTDSRKAEDVMRKLYQSITRTDRPLIITDIKSAEMIKYAANAMLATRISFMNEVARLCEKVGADVKKVAQGIGLDSRIGSRFLQAGVGYGGSCFPKDVQAFIQTMKENNTPSKILEAVDQVNDEQKKSLLPKIKSLLPDLKDKTIAIWGLAFKPKTDDMREAPAITIINQLQAEGAKIRAFDPEAQETAKKILKDIEYCAEPYKAIDGSDALIIATEWRTFKDLDKYKIKQLLKQPNIIDGRNIYDTDEMISLGFNYISVGRK